MEFVVKGNGAREHAIAWKLAESRAADEIFCIGSNAGIATLCSCVEDGESIPENALRLRSEKFFSFPEKHMELPCFLVGGRLYPVAVVTVEGDMAVVSPRDRAPEEIMKQLSGDLNIETEHNGIYTLTVAENGELLASHFGFGEFGAQALLPVLRGDLCKMLSACENGMAPEFRVVNSCTVLRKHAVPGQKVHGLSALPGNVGVFINACEYTDSMTVTAEVPLYLAVRGETIEKSAEAMASAEDIIKFSD